MKLNTTNMTKFNGLKVIKGLRFEDTRGYFREIHKKNNFKKDLIFWCMSKSKKYVLRGMHLQIKNPQDKYISVIKGKILDVVIDCRPNSKSFGKHFKIILSDKNCTSLFIPKGFAHGFLTLEKENIIFYGNSNYRSAKSEMTINWHDPDLNIKWPKCKKIISKKDRIGIDIKEFKKLIK